MCLLLFYLFIYSFIYLLAAEGYFYFFSGACDPSSEIPTHITKDIFLRQKIIQVPPRIFLTEMGLMFRPQGFLLKSPYTLTCEYPPGTVGHDQVKSSPGVKCSESESSCRVNSHFVSGNWPPGQ